MPSRSTERNFADFGEVVIIYNILFRRIIPIPTKSLLSLFWPTFQSLIYELVDEDGCSSSFDISTRITQCAGFSSIRMYDDHDEVSHWVKSEQSEDCKHVFFWIFWLEGLGIYWRYRNRYRAFWVPEKSIGIGIGKIWYRKKVSVSVSSKFGTGKKYRYRYRRYLVPEKSIGIGIAQNYGYRHTLTQKWFQIRS